jgi:hypothetical protein
VVIKAQPELLSAGATFDFLAAHDRAEPFTSKLTLPHLNPGDPTTAEERVCKGTDDPPSIQYVFHEGVTPGPT